MSGVLNDCDALLQAASVRILNPDDAFINLTASAPGFHVTGAGAVDLATVTITADLVALDGDVVFTGQGVTLSNVKARSVDASYVSGTGIVTATVVTNGETFARSYVIPVLRDGATGGSAKVLTLSPTEHVFKITKTGANSPESITLTASGQNLGGTPSFTVPIGTATLAAGANALQKILTFANMGTDSVTVQVAQDGQVDRVTIFKVREGADGVDAITGLLTNESVTLPASSAGVVSSFSGAECSMKLYKGVSDDTANWSFAYAPASSASSLAYATNAGTVTVTGMAAGVDAAYVDITASKAGVASITKRFTVTKSRAGASVTGARGAGHYYVAGSSWSDVVAQAACPGGSVVNDVVTISSGTFVMEKRWTGSAWVENGVVINGKLIVPDSILASAIDTRGLTVRAPDGTVLLGSGVPLAESLAPPGTRNSEQQWQQVGGRPEDVSNLIKKGSFEDGLRGRWDGAQGVENAPAANGFPYGKCLVTHQRDVKEEGNNIPVTPGETIYFSAWMDTTPTAYVAQFGAFVCDKAGNIIFYADPISQPARQGWTKREGSFVVGPNAAFIVPWVCMAGTVFNDSDNWLRVADLWIGRHARGATVGATWGVNVGGSNKPSDNATVGATIGINLGGQFNSGNVSSMFVPGSLTDTQIGGNLKSSNWNGSTGVGGQGWLLERATGNLYGNNVVLRGAIMSPNMPAWGQWPSDTNQRVTYYGPEGFMLGNHNAGRFIHAYANGDFHMPGFEHVGGQLTLRNTIIIDPKIPKLNGSVSSSPPNTYYFTVNRNTNGAFAGAYEVTIAGADGTETYDWSVSIDGGIARAWATGTNTYRVSVWVYGNGYIGEVTIGVGCTVNRGGISSTFGVGIDVNFQ